MLVPVSAPVAVGALAVPVEPRRMAPPPGCGCAEQAGAMAVDEPGGTVRPSDASHLDEPEPKRQRTTVRPVGSETLEHVDMEADEYFSSFMDVEIFDSNDQFGDDVLA